MKVETSQCVLGYRRVCQDAVGVFERPASTVLVVADGAGGIEDGEVASRSVVELIQRSCSASEALVDWVQVLRQADHGLASGQSTACVAELHAGGLRGASVGDSGIAMLVDDELVFPSDGQQRKPLLGTGEAVPRPFAAPWNGGLVILGSDGFWNYVRRDRLLADLRFIDFPVLGKTLVEMVRLPSGGLADDTAVLCARRRQIATAKRRLDLLAGDA